MSAAHWHVRLRWREGASERAVDVTLPYRDGDTVLYVAHEAARQSGAPLAHVVGFNCDLVGRYALADGAM